MIKTETMEADGLVDILSANAVTNMKKMKKRWKNKK